MAENNNGVRPVESESSNNGFTTTHVTVIENPFASAGNKVKGGVDNFFNGAEKGSIVWALMLVVEWFKIAGRALRQGFNSLINRESNDYDEEDV